jgi:vacuolar-type H+-ATPase subunit C/Vma6
MNRVYEKKFFKLQNFLSLKKIKKYKEIQNFLEKFNALTA